MISGKYKLDHIVYTVEDIDTTASTFKNIYGLNPAIEGRYFTQGTENTLIGLGENSYRETLVLDHKNNLNQSSVCMGVHQKKLDTDLEVNPSPVTRIQTTILGPKGKFIL